MLSVLEILMVKGIAESSLCSLSWGQRFGLSSCLLLSLSTVLLRLQAVAPAIDMGLEYL